MKWFKHYTDSLSDPFIEELMDNFAHAGYVAWFGLIEIICKENGNDLTGNLEISPTYLKRKLRISQTKLQQIFNFCQTNAKLSFNYSQEKWSFQFPKVAEIKDNYTKDLQVTCKKLSNHKEVEKEKEKEVDKKKKDIGASRPDDISEKLWKDFKRLRKEKRAPLTETALDGIREEAEKAKISIEAALKECCTRGWQGFKAEWYLSKPGVKEKGDHSSWMYEE